MWVGLLIFYVANVIQVHFSYILYDIFVYFVTAFPAQKPYLCTEFQSALKLRKLLKQRKQRKLRKTTQTTKTNTNHYEPTYLPAAQPKRKGRV